MTNKPKAQGTALESWLVNKVNDFPLSNLHAQRIAEGGSKDIGDVQIVTAEEDDPWIIECKSTEVLNVTRALAKARKKNTKNNKTALVWRRLVKPKEEGKTKRVPDGEKIVVVIALDDYLALLEGEGT